MSDNYKMRLPYKNFNGLRIIGKDTATVAVVEQWAADQGHTDFIVRACNAHHQLVAALRALYSAIDSSVELTPEVLHQARAVLAIVAATNKG